jgi:hypothetical protein
VDNWNTSVSGNFNSAANRGNGVPISSDTAVFRRGDGVCYTVSLNTSAPGFPTLVHTVDRFVVGSNVVTLARLNLGGSTTLAVNNATTTASGRGIVVGDLATYTETLNTSFVVSGVAATIADATGFVGTWNVNPGSVTISNNGEGGAPDSHSLIVRTNFATIC